MADSDVPDNSTKQENLLQKSNKEKAPIVKRLSVHFALFLTQVTH